MVNQVHGVDHTPLHGGGTRQVHVVQVAVLQGVTQREAVFLVDATIVAGVSVDVPVPIDIVGPGGTHAGLGVVKHTVGECVFNAAIKEVSAEVPVVRKL